MGELAKTFGAKLKLLRSARGFTQASLGDTAGVSEEWVRRIERGEGAPSFDMIEGLCAALGIGPADLFEPARHTAAFHELVAQIEGLEPREIDWLLALVNQIKVRPGR